MSAPLKHVLRPGLAALALLGLVVTSPFLHAEDRAALRDSFRSALAAAPRTTDTGWKRLAAPFVNAHYPLAPYIELAALRARTKKLQADDVKDFIARWPDTLAAADLRETFLRELARRGDWTTFRAMWVEQGDRDLQCYALIARPASAAPLDYARDLDALWQGDRALPDACAPVLAAARRDGVLDDAKVWERLIRAADAGRADSAAQAAALLDGPARTDADRIVSALRDPRAALTKAGSWSDTPRVRDAVSYAFARLARRDSAAAETAWSNLQASFKWDAPQKNRILNAIALYRSTSFSDDALARLKALPPEADDDSTREWHVRVALASGDYAETLAAIDAMPEAQRTDPRWRYLRARMLGKLGRDAEANAAYAEVAGEANYYGFLAADWTQQPYTICPLSLASDETMEAKIAQQPDLARSFEFRELGMLREARREWAFAMKKLDDRERQLAADFAYRQGWYDRAVFAYSREPETMRLYEQRFPLGMETRVRREARGAGIDPAWAYAIIRAESAWMTDAHSHADAYGLMQLLPGVAKQVAKAEKLPYSTARDLFDPNLNVQLGTRFLGRMADKFDGSPWLASAAYNAGVARVASWLDARGSLDPDFFVETIPFKETREYVSRVLAFSVIYDWRMNGKVLALSARMPKVGQDYQAPDAETPRKPVVCPANGATEQVADGRAPAANPQATAAAASTDGPQAPSS